VKPIVRRVADARYPALFRPGWIGAAVLVGLCRPLTASYSRQLGMDRAHLKRGPVRHAGPRNARAALRTGSLPQRQGDVRENPKTPQDFGPRLDVGWSSSEPETDIGP